MFLFGEIIMFIIYQLEDSTKKSAQHMISNTRLV
jgi:hypothetical protein